MRTVIIGAGGHSRVIIDILRQNKNIEIVGIIDKAMHPGEKVDGIPIIGPFSDLDKLKKEHDIKGIVIGVGDNLVRADYYNKLEKKDLVLVNAIHPSASIAPDVKIGRGVVVAREAVICTGAKIGNNVIINTGAIIEHEDILEDHCHIAPGVNIAGRVHIKKGTFVGIGTTIIQKVTIGHNTIVGAGSIVIEDIPDDVVAVGIPAKVKKKVDTTQEFSNHQVYSINK
ncbi:acetyltransferase [candidate division KSB1 bacterium]